jgi:hypothetical protein
MSRWRKEGAKSGLNTDERAGSHEGGREARERERERGSSRLSRDRD